jgi:hypothetical protein
MADISYPITKEQLQKGFLIKKQIEINERNKCIEEYIQNEINIISTQIINNTIDEAKYNNLESLIISNKIDDKKLEEIFIKIKEQQIYLYYFKQINDINNLRIKKINEKIGYYKTTMLTKTEIDNIKQRIYILLKERFPDCIIQMDPLKMYILIDWN